MPRFYASPLPGETAFACLDEGEMHHARDVMRLREGEDVVLMISSRLYASVFSPDNRFPLLEALPDTESDIRFTLFQGIPKGDRMDTVCQKCTEAGISDIRPVAFERCVAVWNGKDLARKGERLARIVREAAKQSGRSLCPAVSSPVTPREMCASFAEFDAVLIPWEGAKGPGPLAWWQSLTARPGRVALVIGPEGGISEGEIALMRDAGGIPITLGPRILRTETAGLCALTALMALSGNMECPGGGEKAGRNIK